MMPLLIGAAVAVVVVGVAVSSGVFSKDRAGRSTANTANFSIADYRQDGSRFASAGNSYVFEGRVESIETIGANNDRIVCISIPNNPKEYLPLLVPGKLKKQVNITRLDTFRFETYCSTGRTADGEQVKGVLIVKNVETK